MQNQDPTADTDPNEYINQLVQVNSLEQLIDINQTLSSATGGSGSTTGGSNPAPGATPGVTGLNATNASAQLKGAAHNKANATTAAQSAAPAEANPAATYAARLKHAPGNLSVPPANTASHRVAHTLDGRSHTKSTTNGLPGGR
jgi:flagellar basal-body rod modification protein FlgD